MRGLISGGHTTRYSRQEASFGVLCYGGCFTDKGPHLGFCVMEGASQTRGLIWGSVLWRVLHRRGASFGGSVYGVLTDNSVLWRVLHRQGASFGVLCYGGCFTEEGPHLGVLCRGFSQTRGLIWGFCVMEGASVYGVLTDNSVLWRVLHRQGASFGVLCYGGCFTEEGPHLGVLCRGFSQTRGLIWGFCVMEGASIWGFCVMEGASQTRGLIWGFCVMGGCFTRGLERGAIYRVRSQALANKGPHFRGLNTSSYEGSHCRRVSFMGFLRNFRGSVYGGPVAAAIL